MKVAFATLGCKVNQYDSQAMLETFLQQGYQVGSFDEICDVYVVNTCTVTGTGDKKSLQMVRRAARVNPQAAIVVAGCLSQREGEGLFALPGVRLVLGTARRGEAAQLLQEALRKGVSLCAVEDLKQQPFEELHVSANEGHTRAVLKIQEGCENRCAYCIIPDVRGPVRSRPIESVRREAARLGAAGYQEIVLTGIHLCSYGRDIDSDLLQAIQVTCAATGVARVRLGSLEPSFITREVAQRLASYPSLCRQFHLSLQSGSDDVLRAMRRHYSADGYRQAVAELRGAMAGCAITTDVIAGFPGEGAAQWAQTMAFAKEMQFARMHVFPYSERAGTPAAAFPEAVPMQERRRRTAELIALAAAMEEAYVCAQIGQVREVLLEEDGRGVTREYVRVRLEEGGAGEIIPVAITDAKGTAALGRRAKKEEIA